jgi:hypothetical protein
MPYTINNFNGTTFTTLADGVIDRQFSSSIFLIGRNVTGYGSFQNDNFLWLLQNFAGKVEPTNKIQGQTWFDTTNGVLKLKVYDGGKWKSLTNTLIENTAPESTAGDLWYKTDTQQIFLGTDTGTNWTLVGPEIVLGFGKTKFESGPLLDVNTQTHASIRLFTDGRILGTITTTSFAVNHSEDVYLAGIQTVNKGISLTPGYGLQLTAITAGSTSTQGTITGDWSFTAQSKLTAPNANLTYASIGTVATTNITAGYNTTPGTLTGRWSLGSGSTLLIGDGSLITRTLNAGSTATTGLVTGDWSLSPGSKLRSTYADLAENYTADDTYSPGVVMEFGGVAETTMCQTDMSTRVAGIISTAPAFLLNDQYELEGYTYSIALSGRVPCYVKGTINKGDMLVAGKGGFARAESNPKPGTIIARAIDNYDSEDIGMIEVQVCRG